jgi:hypothetical protein
MDDRKKLKELRELRELKARRSFVMRQCLR